MWSSWSWMEKSSLAARWAGTMLSQPSGSALPQIPHCSLIQGILDVPRPLPATPRHIPVPSQHFLTIAPPGCVAVLRQLLKTSWHLLATPWHLPDTFCPFLAPPSSGGALTCLEALSTLSLPRSTRQEPTGWEGSGIIPRTVGGEGRSCPHCPALL